MLCVAHALLGEGALARLPANRLGLTAEAAARQTVAFVDTGYRT